MFKKITVTGTKGKTTIVRLLDYLMFSMKYKTLRVDTDGHYVNGKQKSDYLDSREYWGMVPNNCPGRYLFELKKFSKKRKQVAILEAAIGSSSLFGLGYAFHDVGMITNIYDDHITKIRIKNRDDIYKAKRFILKKTSKKGFFIFNGDDDFLTKKLSKESIVPRKIVVGKSIKNFNKKDILAEDGIILKIYKNKLLFESKSDKYSILNFKDIPFSFDGKFEPNVYNISFVIAGMISLLGEKVFKKELAKIIKKIKKYKPFKNGGRLVFLKSKKKNNIIIDFAHEKESFKQIALLVRHYSKNRVIGVLRLDPSRIDEDIKRTARYIYKYYDFICIYDKVDGVIQDKSRGKAEGKTRGVGEVAKIFAKELKDNDFNSFEVILEKEKALKKAYSELKQGDSLVYIGDGYDHKKEIRLVKKIIK